MGVSSCLVILVYDSALPWALNTIASKPQHDKATQALNADTKSAIV
jgi:hypothetical protein